MKNFDSCDRKLAAKNTTMGSTTEPTSHAASQCLYRLEQVLARIPVSRSAWLRGVKTGFYPSGRRLGPRTIVWCSDDIDTLIENLKEVAA